MSVLVAKQSHFDSVQEIGANVGEGIYAIVRCRCQPNTCTRPICSGCVQCLRHTDSPVRNNQLLEEFLAV